MCASDPVVYFVIALLLVISTCESVSDSILAVGSRRSLLRVLDESEVHDAALELNASSFDKVLESYDVKYAVVEFFASWCPACRNYKPHYEKVARLFNGPDAVHPGLIVMARVDCAPKMNKDLCDRFSVNHFPQLLWGPPKKFSSGSWDPKKVQSDIKLMDDIRPAANLLNWINKQLGSLFNLDDKRYDSTVSWNTSQVVEIAHAIYDVEETTAVAFDIIFTHKMINISTRVHLIKFLQILVAHHPSKRCQRGSAELLMKFSELWPPMLLSANSLESNANHDSDVLKNFEICGKDIPRGSWRFCRGSKKDTRGFSCGLWVLLHSLTVRVGDGESQSTFTVICDFIHNFFICDECRQHFYEMCSKVSVPVNTTRDLALWFWSTHNKVNERLKNEEKSLKTGDPKFPKMIWPSKELCPSCERLKNEEKSLKTGDPKFPKMIWPSKELCPSCYLDQSKKSDGTIKIEWNRDEVFSFLVRYYGTMLVSSYKDATLSNNRINQLDAEDAPISTSAVTVPMGAALGIAFASCAFGALAWFWRMHQKNRKPKRRAEA